MSKYKKGDRFEIKIGEPIKTDGATLYRVGNFDSMVMTDFALDTFKRINRHDCKYDCSKALDYTHEQARMHKDVKSHEVNCESCPLYDIEKPRGCDCPETQERIDVLQAWSDSRPEEVEHEKTLKEDFLEKFPDAERNSAGNPKVNPCDIYGEEKSHERILDNHSACLRCHRRLARMVSRRL